MKKLMKYKWAAGAAVIAALALAVTGSVLFLGSGRRMRVEHAYYVEVGKLVESQGSWSLAYREDRGTVLSGSGEKKNMTEDGTVLYLKEEDKVLLPQPYVLQFAADNYIYRMEYFSTAQKTEEGILLRDGADSVLAPGGILYDGKDTYVFLEDVRLTVDGESRELPALSSIHAVYANRLEICSYPGGAEEIPLYVDSQVEISFSEGRLLMPLTDRVLLANQSWQLMVGSADYLPRINAWKE